MQDPKNVKILIVEDSKVQSAHLARILQGRDYQVFQTSDGVEALEFLEKNQPTMVISDVTMPRMDGYDLSRKIRQNPRFRDMPVILVTAPDLHLGHGVLIRKMAQFQQLGHEVTFLIGDFTGLIGDPTGKKATRPPLTQAEILANAETYKAQVFKILDPATTKIRFNSEWFGNLAGEGWIRLASRFTVAQMLERNDFSKRFCLRTGCKLHDDD